MCIIVLHHRDNPADRVGSVAGGSTAVLARGDRAGQDQREERRTEESHGAGWLRLPKRCLSMPKLGLKPERLYIYIYISLYYTNMPARILTYVWLVVMCI